MEDNDFIRDVIDMYYIKNQNILWELASFTIFIDSKSHRYPGSTGIVVRLYFLKLCPIDVDSALCLEFTNYILEYIQVFLNLILIQKQQNVQVQ